jgi:nucleoside-diphosphate-sugar epimerase
MTVMDMENPGGVLISGGRGFVGRSLGKLLQRHTYRVISTDVTPPDAGSNGAMCDITDISRLREVFQTEQIGAIVHLAAILPTAAQREPQLATRVNVQGSINLLQVAREFGVPRFIFGSSLSVYGTCPTDQVVSEKDRAAPEDLYGAAKLYVEQLGEAYRQACGLEFASLRIGRVVGAGARSTTSAWRSEIFERLRETDSTEINIPCAESDRILLVHVEDVARMLFALLRAERLGHTVYNAGCESVMVGELKSELERLNPRLQVKLAGQAVVGNPRRVDWSRLAGEFGFRVVPIIEQLARAAGDPEGAPRALKGE